MALLDCPECGKPISSNAESCPHCGNPPAGRHGNEAMRGIVCPNQNCGYRGKPRRKARGSMAMGCLLTILLVLPGLIYFVMWHGYRYYCPECGMQVAVDN